MEITIKGNELTNAVAKYVKEKLNIPPSKNVVVSMSKLTHSTGITVKIE